jgi:hypothetical protein
MSFSLHNGKEGNAWEQNFSLRPDDVTFELCFYDLYSGDEKKLLLRLREVLAKLQRPDLSGPIYLIVRELLTNSLKALYKRIYLEYFLAEMGFSDLPYEDWLSIFKTEIDTHMAENFANICRQKNLYVQFNMKPLSNGLLMEIVNEGIPSEVEWRRLQKSMNNSKEYDSMAYLFENDDEGDILSEGAGIGVPLISVMLKNMNLNLSDFNVIVDGGKTVARLFFPFSFFIKKPS